MVQSTPKTHRFGENMCGSSKPPKPAPPPAAPPVYSDRDVQGSYGKEKDRQRAKSGRASTILTGKAGLSTASTGKSVLGG